MCNFYRFVQFISCNLFSALSCGCHWLPQVVKSVFPHRYLLLKKNPQALPPLKIPSIQPPKDVSLLKILAYAFVFSAYVKYCSSQRLPRVVPVPWCTMPACDQQDCTNHRWKLSDCFFPIWFCVYRWPTGLYKWRVEPWWLLFSFFFPDGVPSWFTPWFQWDAQSLFISYYTAFL